MRLERGEARSAVSDDPWVRLRARVFGPCRKVVSSEVRASVDSGVAAVVWYTHRRGRDAKNRIVDRAVEGNNADT